MNLPPKPSLLPKPGAVKLYRSLYSYKANNADELSFEEGDLIYVSEQSSDGWWKAKCKGITGLIPYNYVTEQNEIKHPLHDAVRRGNIAFLDECLAQGVSATGLDAMGNTPLYWASHSGHLDCLQALLALSNPPINVQNHVGDTPLHAASSRGHLEACEALLKHGADVTLANNDKETALDLAMDPAVKNLLQLSQPSRNTRTISFDPQDYEDDSDS